jgi:hypothetical protein
MSLTEPSLLSRGTRPVADYMSIVLLGVTFLSNLESELQVCHMYSYTEILPDLRRWAAVPLRLIVGYGFIAHGYSKLAHGPSHFAAILHALSVPAPELMAWDSVCLA